MRKYLVVFSIMLALSPRLFGGEANIGPVSIEHLTLIAVATGGHIAGNMEVKITGGFTIPKGLTCTDTNYLTTLKATDPDRAMLGMLLKVQKTTQPIQLRITDNPTLMAYPNRRSIEWVDLQ
jgi:hypothetical protein